MERIKGEMLGKGWVNRSEESKTKVLIQLRSMILEMRELRPPKGIGISSVSGGQLYDGRLSGALYFGPFPNIQSFHRHLRTGMDFDPRLNAEIQDFIRLHDRDHWPIMFTHGDLSSMNVLVRGDDIVGIIDWETAGWYPSYWEYTTACQVNPHNSFWIKEIDNFLNPMPEDLNMERLRQKYFNDF